MKNELPTKKCNCYICENTKCFNSVKARRKKKVLEVEYCKEYKPKFVQLTIKF